MKRHILFAGIVGLLLCSCSDNKQLNEPQIQEAPDDQQVISLDAYDEAIYNNRDLIIDWASAMDDYQFEGTKEAYLKAQERYSSVKEALLPQAKQFVSDLGLTQQEIESATEVQNNTVSEYEDTQLGVMMLIAASNCSLQDNSTLTRGGSFKDCFLEATGIAAGCSIIKGLSSKTVSKQVVIRTLKLVAKMGVKNFAGLGIALIAAEIVWCMW